MLLATSAVALLLAAPTLVVLWRALRAREPRRERDARALRLRLYARLAEREYCLGCRAEVRPDFLACPACGLELRRRCPDCSQPVSVVWAACPYCAADCGAVPA